MIHGRTAALGQSLINLMASMNLNVPKIAVTCGSGLATILDHSNKFINLNPIKFGPLDEVNLPQFNAEGHVLKFIIGQEVQSKEPVLFITGRKHHYEFSDENTKYINELVRIPRALALAGVETFIFTSAVGGINPHTPGSFILVEDHTGGELLVNNPFNQNPGKYGPFFFPTDTLYSRELIEDDELKSRYNCTPGTLQWFPGPYFETKKQIEILQKNGINGVGMSMLHETLAIQQMKFGGYPNLKNIGIGIVSNPASGMSSEPITHESVQQVMRGAGSKLIDLLSYAIAKHFA